MRYSIKPRDRIYVKGYGFLSFAKNMGKVLNNKCAATSATNIGQKLLDSAKKSITDAIKTASKRAIQKTSEETSDLIGNKDLPNDETENVEIDTPNKRYISPEERKQIIEKLRLVPKMYVWIKMHVSEER